jgi:hypothetical protein
MAVCAAIFCLHAVGCRAFINPTSILGASGWSVSAFDSELNEEDWHHKPKEIQLVSFSVFIFLLPFLLNPHV